MAQIGLLGFGEVGQMLAADISRDFLAFDIQFDNPQSVPFCAARQAAQVQAASSTREFQPCPSIIISAVTAGQVVAAVESVLPFLESGCWYFDVNSAAPNTKQRCAEMVNQAGGKYIEASVMSPVSLKRLDTPILLGGPYIDEFTGITADMGFSNVSCFSNDYGPTAAAKICRSILIKGIEAILSESLVTARSYGVDDMVIRSLDDLFAGPDWNRLAKYMIERAMKNGARRAEEMREAAETVRAAGMTPLMSHATADRQEWAKNQPNGLEKENLGDLLDSLCKNLREANADH